MRASLSAVDGLLASGRAEDAFARASSALAEVDIGSLDRLDLEAAGHLANIAGGLARDSESARGFFELSRRCFEALHDDPLDWKSRVNAAIALASRAALDDGGAGSEHQAALTRALQHLEAAASIEPTDVSVRREHTRVLAEAIRRASPDAARRDRERLVEVATGLDDQVSMRHLAEHLMWLAVDARQQGQPTVALAYARQARAALRAWPSEVADWFIDYLRALSDLEVAESGLAANDEVARSVSDALTGTAALVESRPHARPTRHLRVRALLAATALDLSRTPEAHEVIEGRLAEARDLVSRGGGEDPELHALVIEMQTRAAIRLGDRSWLAQAEDDLAKLEQRLAGSEADTPPATQALVAVIHLEMRRAHEPDLPRSELEPIARTLADNLHRQGHRQQAQLVADLVADLRGRSADGSE